MNIFRSRWLRRLGIVLAALFLFWGLAWLAVPLLLKNQAEKWGSQFLGRTLTLEEVDFKPWSLELSISNLAIAGPAGDTHSKPQLHVDRIYVDADWSSLAHRAVVLNTIAIVSPALRLDYQGDGRYDIDDILQRLKAAPENKEPDPNSKPLLFSLANVALTGGSIDLTDRSATTVRTHQLRDLQLALPLLSNFDTLRNATVTPRLAFVLNGNAVDTTAQATPFGSVRKGEATLKATKFDLAPYLPYLPSHLPIRIHSAVLDTELHVRFEQPQQAQQTQPPHLGLSGKIKLSDLRLTDTAGADLAQLASVVADVSDVRPLEQVVDLASLELNALTVHARRNPKGVLNLAFGSTQDKESKQSATKSDAPPAHSTGPTAQNNTWKLALKHFTLHQGNLNWADDSVQPAVRQSLTRLELQATNLHWPSTPSATSATSASLEGSGVLASRTRDARVQLRAAGTPQAGQAHVSLSEIGLELAAPYVAQYLQPGIAGLLDAELDASWEDNTLAFELQRLALRDFALTGPKIQMVERTSATANTATSARDTRTEGTGTGARVARLRSNDWPQWKLLEISNAQINPAKRAVHVGKITLLAPQVGVARGQDGRWMFQHWLKAAAPARPVEADVPTTPLPPWTASLDELAIQEGTVAFADRRMEKPVRLELSALALQAQNLSLDGKQPAPLQLSARLRSGRTEPGTLRYQGSVMWAPVAVQGTLDLRDLPLHAVTPYMAERLNIDLLRADASFKGDMRFSLPPGGPEVQVKGDAALEDFRANSLLVDTDGAHLNEELLSWKSLNMPGIALTLAPGIATRFAAREAALSDFYARVIVGKTGRINLQDLIKSPPAQTSTVVTDSAPTPTAAQISMGPISLVNGKVLFSDRFIQPNYSADLSALTGKLSQFSSAAPDGETPLADLELHGRAEGSASLEITGKVNPLAHPLVLNIKGRVRDLELPPLSPYAVKYAGYGIERGKLGMDVGYTITPDGQLTANNNVMLNQLVFGDKVDGAPNNLPVKLAVALLSDSKGVIDINLPISGSINDPQFSLGAVAWKAISNLLVKAVSAPFNLLASALGGLGTTEEAGVVHFAPGSSALSQQAMQTLDKIAKALADRPALTLTITGTASLEQERDALKRERLNALLLAEKRRRAVVSGQDAAAVTSFDTSEASVLLKEVYKRADITKPRNVLGLVKEIAESDMATLLLTNIHLNAEAMYELAQERSAVVKDYLLAQQLSEDRLFLGAAQVVQPEGKWTPSASLSLAHR